MKVNLLGVRDYDNIKLRDGNTLDGVKLFISYPDLDVQGQFADGKYIDRKVFENFGTSVDELAAYCGSCIDVEFDPKRKIVGIKYDC